MTEEEKRRLQGQRLELFYKSLKFNGKAFAKHIECSQALISPVVNGKKEISRWLINKITGHYKNFNEGWLLTGIGDMYKPSSEDTEASVIEPIAVYEKKNTEGGDPFELLRLKMEGYDIRIKSLEEEMDGIRALLGSEGKGSV